MDRHSFIDSVYKKVTEKFVSNISQKNKEHLEDAYLKYLHSYYDKLFIDATDNELNRVATMCVKREKTIHLCISEEAKNAFLFPDKAYLSMEEISFEIGELARSKRNQSIVTPTRKKEEYIELLQKHMRLVGEIYKYSAEKVYSDALVDLEYIYSDNTQGGLRTTSL